MSSADGAAVTRTHGRWSLRRAARVVAEAVAWLAIGPVAFAFAARAFGWESGPLSYVVAVVPWLTAWVLVVAAAVTVARLWRPAVAAGLLAGIGVAWAAPLFIGEESGEPVLTVATINLRYGSADPDHVVATLRERDVDIVAFEELTIDAVSKLTLAGIGDQLPYSAVYPGTGAEGTAIYSRYPLTGGRQVPGAYFATVRAEVDTPSGVVTFLAVHPRPPQPSNTTGWLDDMAHLESLLEAEDGPVIVAGDLNATHDHAAFRGITSLGYRDAVEQAGAGWVPTFPARGDYGALVSIDHVLVRDAPLVAVSAVAVVLRGTDHRALIVEYAAS